MPRRIELKPKQMPLELFAEETVVCLSPSQEAELGGALADLLLQPQEDEAGRVGGER